MLRKLYARLIGLVRKIYCAQGRELKKSEIGLYFVKKELLIGKAAQKTPLQERTIAETINHLQVFDRNTVLYKFCQ